MLALLPGRLATPPQNQTMSIDTINHALLTGNKLVLTPSYQRAPCWKQSQSNGLMETIMLNQIVLPITLYKLHPGDEGYAAGSRYECVDGQNRLRAISAFLSGRPICNSSGREDCVTWRSHSFADLDEECQDAVRGFTIPVLIIQAQMSLDDRKAMFTRLQDGSKISSAEYAKNTKHPVSVFTSATGLRDRLLPVLNGFMAAAVGEWMNLITDCCTLFASHDSEYDVLDRDHSEVIRVLKGKLVAPGTKYYMPLPVSDYEALTTVFDELIALLTAVKENTTAKCCKFHVVVLFKTLLAGQELTVLQVRHWLKEAPVKLIVERSRDGLTRSPEIYRHIQEVLFMPVEAEPPPRPRRKIPKKKRDALWTGAFGLSPTGTCQCCEAPITIKRWDQAHIIAVAVGGSNELDNLVPTCVSCNRSCGTENLLDWTAREWPRARLLQ